MPLSEKGYSRPTYDELLDRQIRRAKTLFGNDIDTSPNTALGKYIRLNVEDDARLYEENELIYYSAFSNTARGVSLDRLCTLVGIARNPATFARHKIRFHGTAGERVPDAFEVGMSTGDLTFHLYRGLEIGSDGTVEGIVECEKSGVIGNVAIGKIDMIVNPNENVESIEHIGVESYGVDVETDSSLRKRFNKSTGIGTSTAASLRGAILRVPMVQDCIVIENKEDTVVDGINPHSFMCYVVCPASQDSFVAKAILDYKPLGIQPSGSTVVELIDERGIVQRVAFTHTLEKSIFIKAEVLVNQYFNADGVEQIKQAIVDEINALEIGDTVYLSSIYGCFHDIDGVLNVPVLTMSTDGTAYSGSNIPITLAEVARIAEGNIEVVVST